MRGFPLCLFAPLRPFTLVFGTQVNRAFTDTLELFIKFFEVADHDFIDRVSR